MINRSTETNNAVEKNMVTRGAFWQSKKFKFILILFIIWMIVTIYFYRQHCRSVYTYEVNEQIKMNDLTIYIKEFEFENFDRDNVFDDSFSLTKLIVDVAVTLDIPYSIADPFLRAAYFYSSPYTFYDDESWKLKVKGFVTAKTSNIEELSNQFDIYLRGEDILFYPRGLSSSGSTGSNVRFFHKDFESPPMPTKPIKIVLKPEDDDKTQEITVFPEWTETKYNFFKDGPKTYDFRPRDKVAEFVHDYIHNKDQTAEHILPDLRNGFPLSNIDTNHKFSSSYLFYQGNYKDFSDVYVVNTRYFAEDNIEEAIAEQSFYLIMQNGDWYIIDVSPIKEY